MQLLTLCTVEGDHFVPYEELLRTHGDAEVMVVRIPPSASPSAFPPSASPSSLQRYPDPPEGASLAKVVETSCVAVFTRRVSRGSVEVVSKNASEVVLAFSPPYHVTFTICAAATIAISTARTPTSAALMVPFPNISAPHFSVAIHPPHIELCCGIAPIATKNGIKCRILVDFTNVAGDKYRGVPGRVVGGDVAEWVQGRGTAVNRACGKWPDGVEGVQTGDIPEKVSYRVGMLAGSNNPFDKIITASEFGRAAGAGANGSPLMWLEGRTASGLSTAHRFTGNDATRHGTLMEPLARDVYQKLFAVRVYSGGFWVPQQPDYYFLGASPDGIIFDAKEPVRLLEIKCPYYCFPDPGRWPICYKGIDPIYYCQMQGQMSIAGVDICDYVVYHGGNVAVWRVGRNEEFWRVLLKRLVAAHRWVTGLQWVDPSAVYTDVLCESPTLMGSVAASITTLLPPACCTTQTHVATPVSHLFVKTHAAIAAALAASLCLVCPHATLEPPTPLTRLVTFLYTNLSNITTFFFKKRKLEEIEEPTEGDNPTKRRRIA